MFEKVARIVDIEIKRYKKKGLLNIIAAFSLLFGIMYAAVRFGRHYWPDYIDDKPTFVTLWSVGIHFAVNLLGFLLYLPGYLGWSRYLSQHLNNMSSVRPWQRKNWVQVRSKTIKMLIVNQVILYPLLVHLVNLNGIKLRFQDFPTFSEFGLQILFIYYFQDMIFYFFHRLIHYGFLYKYHKVHHEYDTLYSWVSEYAHPFDYAFANLLPGAFPLMVLGNRLHCFTFFYWIFWKILLSVENHSGYEVQWSPFRIFPMIANTSHHDNHHSKNVGNYGGSCYFWDLVLDTYTPYCKEF